MHRSTEGCLEPDACMLALRCSCRVALTSRGLRPVQLRSSCSTWQSRVRSQQQQDEKPSTGLELLQQLVCLALCHCACSCCYKQHCINSGRTDSFSKCVHCDVSIKFLQGQDQGFRVEVAEEEEDAETWEEAMDEMEDTWMREPAGKTLSNCQLITVLHMSIITWHLKRLNTMQVRALLSLLICPLSLLLVCHPRSGLLLLAQA